ncbi:uncharacterized protein L969DRAFT_96851 [Mixia osmundae IAM 14324]|uniref:Uncharacterized protein n=1 Tax=Mixia osmundae (strain CBS 9802 / IAM 14324 / JCM 22182 / KY 12970) TaxID=764103 RepID=G7E2A0_MIXOS|nr:uncharacterized protein L969DRAFT_96851 [Mixia osmundae IAM 14324]KEI36833.1 hypothetical protein L969DRAFT_96851 [Mixia osmundae IAM 14324]GAA96960.1 hypothetical protein E5Q_03634 [Mixia osmundae IAM 14324]
MSSEGSAMIRCTCAAAQSERRPTVRRRTWALTLLAALALLAFSSCPQVSAQEQQVLGLADEVPPPAHASQPVEPLSRQDESEEDDLDILRDTIAWEAGFDRGGTTAYDEEHTHAESPDTFNADDIQYVLSDVDLTDDGEAERVVASLVNDDGTEASVEVIVDVADQLQAQDAVDQAAGPQNADWSNFEEELLELAKLTAYEASTQVPHETAARHAAESEPKRQRQDSPKANRANAEQPQLSTDQERAQRLYKRATQLLDMLQNTVPDYTPPSSSTLLPPAGSGPSEEDTTNWFATMIKQRVNLEHSGPFSPLLRQLSRGLDSLQTAPSDSATSNDAPSSSAPESQDMTPRSVLMKIYHAFSGGRQFLRDPAAGSKAAMAKLAHLSRLAAPEKSRKTVAIGQAMQKVLELLTEAESLGYNDAKLLLANIHLWGHYTVPSTPQLAFRRYKDMADQTGNSTAQSMLAFLYSSGYRGAADTSVVQGVGDQPMALLYHTFAALAGLPEAELAIGYRHLAGIGLPASCQEALPFYKSAASKAIAEFESGPPGGRHLPPSKIRLADLSGGVYGAGASVVSTGPNAKMAAQTPGTLTPTTRQEWEDVLEFYHFHADRHDAGYMFRLGRIYYNGFGGGVVAQLERGEGHDDPGGRDFARALRWFERLARSVWPRDPPGVVTLTPQQPGQSQQATIKAYDDAKDIKTIIDDHSQMVAGLAAGYLGRMYLRGEGLPQDFSKAFLWFSRGLRSGDRESQYGLGLMYRDGLGVLRNPKLSVSLLQEASAQEHTDAQVALGKLFYDSGDYLAAAQYFEHAARHGDTFQSYYWLAEMSAHGLGRPEICTVAVAYYKIVAERGDWKHEVWWEAERAWARGDRQRAFLGYWMMAERGYEQAQNNVAWILDQDKRALRIPMIDGMRRNITDRLALTFWTRSAAQNNIDALVKMGDYYLSGYGTSTGAPQPQKAAACYSSAAMTHVSAMAMHNLGWLHENGIGVEKDFHLAKRYYDLSFETNAQGYLPATLSLLRLYVRSLYHMLSGSSTHSLSLFAPDATTDLPSKAQPRKWWSFGDLRSEAAKRWQNMLEEDGQALQAVNTEDGAGGTNSVHDAQRALVGNEDPVQWARAAQARERAEEALREAEEDDSLFGLGLEGSDDFAETLLILGICFAIAWLVYVRQARQDANARRRQDALMNNQALIAPVD